MSDTYDIAEYRRALRIAIAKNDDVARLYLRLLIAGEEGAGVRLTAEDVATLLADDAVETAALNMVLDMVGDAP
jgi:hypothetical protein